MQGPRLRLARRGDSIRRSISPLSEAPSSCEEVLTHSMICRWQAALRIILSALSADIVAYLCSLAPDAGAASGTAAPEQQVDQIHTSAATTYLTQMLLIRGIGLSPSSSASL